MDSTSSSETEIEVPELPESPCAWCQGTGEVSAGFDEDGNIVKTDCVECE